MKADAARVVALGFNSHPRRIWNYVLNLLSQPHILSVIDQAFVSGTSFVTTLVIARFGSAGELGVYAVGISVLASLIGFQDSLILQPYTIQRLSSGLHPADHSGAALLFSVFVSVGGALILIIASSGALGWVGASKMLAMLFAVAAVLPFVLARDFARRTAIAHLEIHRAVALDAAVALIQLSTLSVLGFTGRMSAITACITLGGANGIVAAGWLYWGRRELRLSLQNAKTLLPQTWDLGKWLLVGRITVQVQGYVVYWIAMAVAGAVTTGIFAACMSIVNVINPLVLAIGNVMTPKFVLAFRSGGGEGLWREAIRSALLIGGVMAVFCLTMIIGGEHVVHWLYPGREYEGSGGILAVLALALTAGALGAPASLGLATMERPRAIVIVGTISAVSSVILVWVSMREWGLLGAVYGMLLGSMLGTIGRYFAFLAHIPVQRNKASVIPVLQQLIAADNNSNYKIAWLGGGEHGDVFRVELKEPRPCYHEYNSIVVKVYKSNAASNDARVRAQYRSLSDLHATLDGLQINEWTICVPRPLYVCSSPLALVMTAVPGRCFDEYASSRDGLTPEGTRSAARAFATAMRQCWSLGRRHGELGLCNVLFDFNAKTISFIDALVPESCITSNTSAEFPPAAAPDLAFALRDVMRGVMIDFTGSPPIRLNREIFIQAVLSSVLDDLPSKAEKRQLLNAIWKSFEIHLMESLEPSWSLLGVSHRFVKRLALSRARSILARLLSESEINTPESIAILAKSFTRNKGERRAAIDC